MNSKTTKSSLLLSSLALLLCFAMLIGTTFAWFTDSATSAGNKIVAGNLDVELYMYDGTGYKNIGDSKDPIFSSEGATAATNDNLNTLWEPGKTQVAYLMIKNAGNLALKYEVALNTINPADSKDLYKVMQYQIVPDATNVTGATWSAGTSVTPGTAIVSANNVPMQPNDEHYFALLVHMDKDAGNEYMNGKVDFDIVVNATQLNSEKDSFGPDYDVNAELPVAVNNVDELKSAVAAGGNIVLADDIELTSTLMAKKDAVIDLNGKTITAPSNGAMFQFSNDTKPSMIITSSTPGAEINAGSNAVLLGYGSTEISNVTINVDKATSTSKPFTVYGDLTLGKGTVVNVNNLGTSLINNNGKHKIVINGAKINVEKFKVNGGAMISLASGTTLELKNTEIKVGLDTTYTSYFISKAENATIEGCTFDVKDASNNAYDIEFKPDSGVGARYAWVVK